MERRSVPGCALAAALLALFAGAASASAPQAPSGVREDLLARAAEVLAAAGDLQVRVVLLEELAASGAALDLELALQLALPATGGAAEAQQLQRKLEEAAAGILARDALGFGVLERRLPDLDPSLATALVRGAARSGSARALRSLADCLPAAARHRPLLLSELANAARGRLQSIDPQLQADVRAWLDDLDDAVARSAAAACAALQDSDACEPLIALLRGERPGPRESAHRALRELTGVGYGAEARLWEAWLQRERAWYERNAPALVERAIGQPLGSAIPALRELAGHRWRRHQLAAQIAPALLRREPEVVLAACGTLTALGSPACFENLLLCIADPDPRIARAAHACLTAISGASLPAEPQACRDALAARR